RQKNVLRIAEREVQTISHDAACCTISANVEKVEKNVIMWTKTVINDDSDNSQNPFVISEAMIYPDASTNSSLTKSKTKTSLDYGIIDLNDSIILKALGNSVTSYFEVKMKDYKPKKAISEEAAKALKKFNVTSIKDLRKALAEVKVDYNNLDHDIVYLHRLFQK
ncbi:16566_t:CDS:2, partial [Entrophospora sp. SA101]